MIPLLEAIKGEPISMVVWALALWGLGALAKTLFDWSRSSFAPALAEWVWQKRNLALPYAQKVLDPEWSGKPIENLLPNGTRGN